MSVARAWRIGDAEPTDFDRIVELNAIEAAQTSAMSLSRLKTLADHADYLRVAIPTAGGAKPVAFLMAMPGGTTYDSANYRWFDERLTDFLYIDRIVVDAGSKGMGIGRALYEDLFAFARARGVATVACEYNVLPANAPSRAFHDRLGFSEIGHQTLAHGDRQVSMQMRSL